MLERVIVISGPVSSGKTTLCQSLESRFGCYIFKTKDLITELLPSTQQDRQSLQLAGERLDRQRNASWIASAISRRLQNLSVDTRVLVIDSVRIRGQVSALRRAFGSRVVHIHLTAPQMTLSERYQSRSSPVDKNSVELLSEGADLVIDTHRSSREDVAVRVAAHLGYYGRSYERMVDVVVGGCYGSEGKGHISAYLSPEYSVLVRVGGPNAGHTVFEKPPYTHHLLPSGTRRCEARLVIGPGAVLDEKTLLKEIADCRIAVTRLFIDPQAMMIDKSDKRFEEAKLRGSIGSTAQGGGRAAARRILRTGSFPAVRLAKDVSSISPFVRDTQEVLDEAFMRGERVLVEGTQGTGLSLYHGHYPYVTSRDTTVSGCLSEAGIAPSRVRRIVMVCRSFPIRVEGPSGFIGNELSWNEIANRSGYSASRLREAEKTSTTKRQRRVAEFDWTLLRKAASLNGPTDIALTFADYLHPDNRAARRFEQLHRDTIRFIEEIERVAASPVSLVSTRFAHRSILDRRAW
jgi:adenylosuccinate synthase